MHTAIILFQPYTLFPRQIKFNMTRTFNLPSSRYEKQVYLFIYISRFLLFSSLNNLTKPTMFVEPPIFVVAACCTIILYQKLQICMSDPNAAELFNAQKV
jgi:hypothetical protein